MNKPQDPISDEQLGRVDGKSSSYTRLWRLFGRKQPNPSEILFEERQSPSPITVALTFAIIIFAGVMMFVNDALKSEVWPKITVLFIFFVFLTVMAIQQLLTRVDNQGIFLRKLYSMRVRILYSELNRIEASSYKQACEIYGKYTVMFSSLHTSIGDAGVLLHPYEGSVIFISSKRAEELCAAFELGRKKYEQNNYASI